MSPEVLTFIGQVGLGAIFLWLFIRQVTLHRKWSSMNGTIVSSW